MKAPGYKKIKLFFKSILNSLLGISVEIFFVSSFILVGFLVSLVWWRILVR